MRLAFTKCHGSGNDFAMVDARTQRLADAEWAGIARALSDRAGPVGSDGLLLLLDGKGEDAIGYRMFNPDGSEAETCLNGLRCVARAGFDALGIAAAGVRLIGSRAQVARAGDLGPGICTVREVAGPASLDVRAWPMAVGADRIVDAPVAPLGGQRFTAVAMPNPHLIGFVDLIDEGELVRIGTICESAPDWLPRRANVSFVTVDGGEDGGGGGDGGGLFVRTFERGVGLTDSCGSAMAAATYAACLTGRWAFDRDAVVRNRGGRVRARAAANAMVTIEGNATYEWEGSAEIDPVAGTARDLTITRRHVDEVAAWDLLRAGG